MWKPSLKPRMSLFVHGWPITRPQCVYFQFWHYQHHDRFICQRTRHWSKRTELLPHPVVNDSQIWITIGQAVPETTEARCALVHAQRYPIHDCCMHCNYWDLGPQLHTKFQRTPSNRHRVAAGGTYVTPLKRHAPCDFITTHMSRHWSHSR